MKHFIKTLCFLFSISLPYFATAQLQYYVPTHYHGIFNHQITSARATGMGLTTITLDGIENAFYNPAAIGNTMERINIHLNYASGNQVYKGGTYPFVGLSYRINDKLILGASTFNWRDEKDSPWSTIIGGFDEPVDRRSQSAYSLIAAYEVVPGLNVGISGNYLVSRSVGGSTSTNTEFILSVGTSYDTDVNLIKSETVKHQKVRIAGSLVNALMKNRIEERYQEFLNFRDLPIHLTFGGAYQFSLPFEVGFAEGKGFFKDAPREVGLSLHLQYRDVLKGPEDTVVNTNHEENSAFGIGAEAWFMDRVAIRMGYYSEVRPKGDDPNGGFWVTSTKKGFTWGFGTKVPLNSLTNGKIPFNTEINLVTSKLLNEYSDNITLANYFTDRNFLFAMGINLKWVDNKPQSQP